MRIANLVVAAAFHFLLVSYSLGQGSLTPPGPPGPTMKSLTEVDTHIADAGEKRIPIDAAHTAGDQNNTFIIKQSGSYYLTGNIKVAGASNGINVQTSGVSIDLNGFTLAGPGKNATGGNAIVSTGNDVRVRNGFIDGWPKDAISFGAVSVVQDLDIQNCGGFGVHAGEQTQVRRCRVGAVLQGITVGDSSVVDSCIVIAGATTNIATGSHCLITHNISNYATQNPGYGIYPGTSSVVRDNVCNQNKRGIFVDTVGVWIEGNIAEQNTVYGINVFEDTDVVIRNVAGKNALFNYSTPASSNVGPIQSPNNMTNPAANIEVK